MMFGPFNQRLSVASQDASHISFPVASGIIVVIGLTHFMACGVHVPSERNLPLLLHLIINRRRHEILRQRLDLLVLNTSNHCYLCHVILLKEALFYFVTLKQGIKEWMHRKQAALQ